MRRSIFLRTLWSFKVPILAWGLGLGAVLALVISAFDSAIYVTSPATKQEFLLAFQSIGWLWDYPKAVASAGGYLNAKYGLYLVLVAIWGLLVGTRMLRGEEESGQIDMLLSAPVSRARVAVEKFAAVFVAMLLIGLIVGVLVGLGIQNVHNGPRFSFTDALQEGLMVSLFGATFAAIGLFVSQFTPRRAAAAGITGALLALSVILNSIGLLSPDTEWVGRLSPVYYFRISKPLVEDYGMNWGAAGILALMIVVFTSVGIWLFLSRDVGTAINVVPEGVKLPALEVAPAENGWSLGSLVARALVLELPRAFWWGLGLGIFYFALTSVAHQMVFNLADSFQGTAYESVFAAMAGGKSPSGNAFLLGLLYSFLPLLIAAMAVTQVSGWERLEAAGQLDLELATPETRAKALLARIGVAGLGVVLVLAIVFVVALIAAAVTGLSLDYGNLAQATLGAAPWGFVVLGLGYLLATWMRRSLVTTVLTLLLAISYGLQLTADALGNPDLVNLSLFYHFGDPLLNGLDWGAFGIVLALGVIFTALAVALFAAKDIGRWAFLGSLGGRRRRRQQQAAAA